jgi:hypothetical protein
VEGASLTLGSPLPDYEVVPVPVDVVVGVDGLLVVGPPALPDETASPIIRAAKATPAIIVVVCESQVSA